MSASGRPNLFCIVISVTCPFKETSIIARKTRLKQRRRRRASMKSNSSPRVVSGERFYEKKKSVKPHSQSHLSLRTRKFGTNHNIIIQIKKIER